MLGWNEACSLAGTLGLGKLIVFYDDNGISIDGMVSNWFTDDTAKRFEAYHWHVVPDVDGHDPIAIKKQIVGNHQSNHSPSFFQNVSNSQQTDSSEIEIEILTP